MQDERYSTKSNSGSSSAGESPRSKDIRRRGGDVGKRGSPKRPAKVNRIPGYLMPLIQFDKKWTRKFALCAGTESTLAALRPHMKAIEWSCHGIPWLAGCMALLFFCRGSWAQQVFLNLLLALVLDVFFVAVIKSVFRRGRPEHNHDDMRITPGFVDVYAFPSGHASRAVMVSLLLFGRFDLGLNLVLGSPLVAWSVVVSVSRVLLGRHHIGDVVVGVLLGYFEYVLVDWLWLGPEATSWFLSFLDADSPDT